MRGRKPKPAILRMGNANGPKQSVAVAPSCRPDEPSHLTGIALEEWHRITTHLESMGLLSAVDETAIATYCSTYARYRDTLAKFESTGLIIKTTNGNMIQNPILGALNTSEREMRKWLLEFGLTPSSRSRIAAGAGGVNEDDPLIRMMLDRQHHRRNA